MNLNLGPELATFMVVLARCTAFLHSAPLTGDLEVSNKVRGGAAIFFALLIYPLRPEVDPDNIAIIAAGEALLGVIAGFAARVVLAGAEAGGDIIAMNMGLTMASQFDPNVGDMASVVRRTILAFAGLAFLLADGLENCVRVIATAPMTARNLAEGMQYVVHLGTQVLWVGVRFAAPLIITGLVVNVGVALAGKASPALNIFSVVLAATIVVCGIVLWMVQAPFVQELSALGQRVAPTVHTAVGL